MRSDDESALKVEISQLILHHFGSEVESTFKKFYIDEPLAEYINQAFEILTDLNGQRNSLNMLMPILRKYKHEELLHA